MPKLYGTRTAVINIQCLGRSITLNKEATQRVLILDLEELGTAETRHKYRVDLTAYTDL
jgi:hypothetical protein